jgi:hypothetical protein
MIKPCEFTEAVDIAGTPIASFNFNQDTDVPKAPITKHQTQAIAATKVSSEIKPAIRDKLIDTRTLHYSTTITIFLMRTEGRSKSYEVFFHEAPELLGSGHFSRRPAGELA